MSTTLENLDAIGTGIQVLNNLALLEVQGVSLLACQDKKLW